MVNSRASKEGFKEQYGCKNKFTMNKFRMESRTLLSGRATNCPLEPLALGTIHVLWGIKHLLLTKSLIH